MNLRKVASLALAAALQVLPLTRGLVVATPATGSSFAIISTWIAGLAALLGGVDAVSGASSISISPTNGTAGVPFSGAVIYSGAHASAAQSWELTKNWSGTRSGCSNIYEIAPGLWLTNAAAYLVRVGGTPTTAGTFSFTMMIHSGTACGGGDSDTRTASITISAGSVTAPAITTPPASQTVSAGGNATFNVTATGTAPLSYQWRRNGANLTGTTNATLALTGVTTNQAGSYAVLVSNSAGSVTSSPAILTVTNSAANHAPTISGIVNQVIGMSRATAPIPFTIGDAETTAANLSLTASSTNVGLLPLTNIVFGGGNTNRTVTLTPVPGQIGNASITITVSDGSATASTMFQLTVLAPPPRPTLLTVVTNL